MTVRLAVIGCGAAARRLHLPGFRAAGADVVCFASRTLASAEAAAAEWGSGEATDDWRAATRRDDVDGIAVCTPNALHAEMTIAAARAGKHVLVEKPLAPTLAEADRMIAAAAGAGVRLVPAHNARFAPPIVAAREAVASGRLGEVISFRIAWGNAGPEAWSPEAAWFRDPAHSGGGALMDLGVHAVDVAAHLLVDRIVEVSAFVGPKPIEDLAQVLVRTERGSLGSVHVSWRAVPGSEHQLTLHGTAATLHFDDATPPVVRSAEGSEALPMPEPAAEPYAGFVRAAADPRAAVPVTAADGRAAVAVVEAAYRSARTGAAVAVDGS